MWHDGYLLTGANCANGKDLLIELLLPLASLHKNAQSLPLGALKGTDPGMEDLSQSIVVRLIALPRVRTVRVIVTPTFSAQL